MAISFVNAGATATAASGAISPGLPSGWAAGDVHVCVISQRIDEAVGMTGWTNLVESAGNASMALSVFYRVAVAGDAAPSVTGSTGSVCAQIFGYRNCLSTPIDQNGTASVNASSTTLTTNGITTGVANAMCLFIGAFRGTQTVSGYSGSPTPTERGDYQNGTVGLCCAEFLITGSGTATGNRTATLTVAGVNVGYQVSLKPKINNKFFQMF